LKLSDCTESFLHPTFTMLAKNGLEVAFEKSSGVLQVVFSVGAGLSDALERLVENVDDALLFGDRRHNNWKLRDIALVKVGCCRSIQSRVYNLLKVRARQTPVQELRKNLLTTSDEQE